jgi:hypothetical protein
LKRIVNKQTPEEQLDKYWMRRFDLSQYLFDKQLAFVEDPAPFKVAICSRRAGKTVSCAAHLIHTAINNPNSNCWYITLTRDTAKRIIWKDLKFIIDKHKLKADFNSTELTIEFQNGSIIYLSGANDLAQIEKFRGMAMKLCYIDECQSFKEYIKDLIDDIISPALIDYAGSLCILGTPGPTPTGYFHECAVKSDAWSKHAWTFWDNPHIPLKSGKTHQETLDRDLKRRGVTADNPSIQREYYGKWEPDSDSLILHYNPRINHFDTLPAQGKYEYIMGVDVGFNDADALSVLAWSESDPTTYLVEELITPKQGITELANQIIALQKKYAIPKIVMDMGALGKKIGEELIRRWHIPVEAADKVRKMENLEILDDALRTGRFKAKETSMFAQDTYKVEKDHDRSTPESIKVSTRYHSDIIDAVLYSFKHSPAYNYEPPVPKPKYGTREYAEQEAKSMFEDALNAAIEEQSYNKYVSGEE